MSPRPVDRETPDRLYTITGGRTTADERHLDVVSLIVSESDPAPGMQSEHVKILEICHHPTAVVEISSYLGLPVGVVRILLLDLLDTGHITVRQPSSVVAHRRPDRKTLERVLVGLQDL